MEEFAAVRPAAKYETTSNTSPTSSERTLECLVVMRRDEERVSRSCSQRCRELRGEGVNGAGRVVLVEEAVELVVQRADPRRQGDVLRNLREKMRRRSEQAPERRARKAAASSAVGGNAVVIRPACHADLGQVDAEAQHDHEAAGERAPGDSS